MRQQMRGSATGSQETHHHTVLRLVAPAVAFRSVQPQLAAIKYIAKGDERNPRQLQVLLPPASMAAGGGRVWMKHAAGETLLERLTFKRCVSGAIRALLFHTHPPHFAAVQILSRTRICTCSSSGMVYMQNKMPEVCGNSYRLNFHGRVKVRTTPAMAVRRARHTCVG